MARDPQAEVVWAGPSWLNWLDKDSVPPMFRHVQAITLKVSKIPAEISELQLQKLSALKGLTFDFGYMWGDKEDDRRTDALLRKSSMP
jgi:hypothetical protein